MLALKAKDVREYHIVHLMSLANAQRIDLLLEMTIYIATHGNIQEAYDTLQRLVQSV